VMLLSEAQYHLRASPHCHQAEQHSEIFTRSPASLAFFSAQVTAKAPHDFFHTTTMAVSEGCA